MSEPELDNASCLVPYGSRELFAPQTAQNRILGEMVENSLALAKRSAVSHADLDALVREGKRLQRMEGMTPEDVRAFQLFHQAAVAGRAEAQFLVGSCYDLGNGVPQDLSEAVSWYRKAAEQGHAGGQHRLGFCYGFFNRGVPRGYAESFNWYRKAAEQGLAGGQCQLGWCYQKGRGVPQDDAEAVKWFRKAVEQGHAGGQYALGWCYLKGRGVPQDIVEATRLHHLAADQGNCEANILLGRKVAGMDAAEQ